MSNKYESHIDLHSLFFISQNEDLEEEERDHAEQELRELSAGHVYVPPPTALVTSQQGLNHNLDNGQDTPEGQAKKETNTAPGQASDGRRKARIAKNRPRKPIVIPPNVEIIVLSSDSENENKQVKLAVRKQQIRGRIYHPHNHTKDSWRCPVGTCARHNPEFGFQNHACVERHLRNRHANELVYPCISGCSLEFSNGRQWERHHRDFHADEVAE